MWFYKKLSFSFNINQYEFSFSYNLAKEFLKKKQPFLDTIFEILVHKIVRFLA